MKKIGWNHAYGVDSYFLEKDRLIAVLNKDEDIKEYNVYDISNDDWMINENTKLNVDIHGNARSLLVCNKLFVISYQRNIYIYSICNDICNPQLIQTYKIKDKTKYYRNHGMCLFECNELKDGKSINFKILLFGEISEERSFLESFLELCIKLSLNYENISDSEFEISEKARKQVKCVNFDPKSNDCNIENAYVNFGFECFLNSKNEPIIIIIGGNNEDYDERVHSSLFEYNIVCNELFLYCKVKCFVWIRYFVVVFIACLYLQCVCILIALFCIYYIY